MCAQLKGQACHVAGSGISLGAAKSRYGHAETGAGAVGLLSAVEALEHRRKAPILHLCHLNSYVKGLMDTSIQQGMSKDLL